MSDLVKVGLIYLLRHFKRLRNGQVTGKLMKKEAESLVSKCTFMLESYLSN